MCCLWPECGDAAHGRLVFFQRGRFQNPRDEIGNSASAHPELPRNDQIRPKSFQNINTSKTTSCCGVIEPTYDFGNVEGITTENNLSLVLPDSTTAFEVMEWVWEGILHTRRTFPQLIGL
jgi:hypothetical protein